MIDFLRLYVCDLLLLLALKIIPKDKKEAVWLAVCLKHYTEWCQEK